MIETMGTRGWGDIYRAVFENSVDAIFVTEADGGILAANPAACAMLGRSEADICALGRAGIVDPGSSELTRPQTESTTRGEVLFVRADGTRLPVEVTSALVTDDQGRAMTVLIARDLSPHVQARAQRAASEAKFHSVVKAMAEGVVFQDAEGRIVETNPAALRIEGRDSGQMLGHTSSDPGWGAVREDGSDFPGDQHPAMVTLRTGEPQSNVVMGIRRPSGERRWISINSEPLFGPEGRTPSGVVTTFHDITERKQIEVQMAEYIARLEHAVEQTLRAVANLVELRDPYTAGHEQRTATLARDIAREMGWPEARCHNVWLTALVHDVGKIAVPAQILTKPGALTDLEFELVKQHPTWGYEIFKDVDFLSSIASVIRQHHERLDGSGYPDGLRGEEILPEARVLAVADAMESRTSHRPYRPAISVDEALEQIRALRHDRYDPEVVDALTRLLVEQGYQLP